MGFFFLKEKEDIKVTFYDGTWEGGWGIMSIQKGEVVATHDKMV